MAPFARRGDAPVAGGQPPPAYRETYRRGRASRRAAPDNRRIPPAPGGLSSAERERPRGYVLPAGKATRAARRCASFRKAGRGGGQEGRANPSGARAGGARRDRAREGEDPERQARPF